MTQSTDAVVLIVGAGPTGLVLALWLTRMGIKVRLIDKNQGPGETSRALVVQGRTLEFYAQLGIADEVVAQGIKLDYFSLRKNGKPLTTINIGPIGVGLTPYSFILSYPQDDHEKLLIHKLEQLGVLVERNTALLSFTQSLEGVRALLGHDGQLESVDFAYLCGCDGARSTTREQLGINFPGGTYNKKFFVADVSSATENLPGLQIGVTGSDFCLAFPVRSSKTIRLIGIVPEAHEQQEEIQFADVRPTVDHNMQVEITQVNWFSTYHVHHRVVPRFRKGRVFLAGDAAHIHSPVGGQGMNTGIGDAINLAWKLAQVIQGKAQAKLLDSYEPERLPFAQKLVATTDKVFQIISSTSFLGKAWRYFIFPHVFPFIFNHQRIRGYFFNFVSQLQIQYRQSPLSVSGRGKVRAGDRLPWVMDAAQSNFTPLTSLNWQVHVYGTPAEPLLRRLKELSVDLHQFSWSAAAKEKALIENAAYLIRPDGYIALIDTTEGAQLTDYIKKL